MSEGDGTAILRAFIADEDEALAAGRQGRFWPSNHHRIRPLADQSAALLAPAERVRFLAHVMRVSGAVPPVPDKALPQLLEAYRLLLPHIDGRGPGFLARRHPLLFIFGFDEAGTLSDGATASAKELKARIRVVTHLGKHTTLPAQRDKRAGFLSFAEAAPRLLGTLRHLGYRHDRRFPGDQYDTMNLAFWGMVLIVLQNPATRAGLLRDMLECGNLPDRDRQLALLDQTVVAVLPDVAAEEVDFLALAEHLASLRRARREATETVALARALGLPFGEDEDWVIQLTIPLQGSTGPALLAPGLALTLRPNPDDPWQIRIRHPGGGIFAEWNGTVTQNDLGIGGLGRGRLSGFPGWLRGLRDRGLAFDGAAADIRAGRKRAVAKAVAQWLSAG